MAAWNNGQLVRINMVRIIVVHGHMDLQVYLVLVQNAPEVAVPSVHQCLVDNRACGSLWRATPA
jgi:hypothetical protein